MKFANDVIKCIYTRRSIRRYLSKKVPKRLIDELLNAGVMAPSAMNSQPWHFTIVEDKELINELARIVIKKQGLVGWLIKAGIKLKKFKSIFYNAPLLIIISGRSSYMWLKDDVNLAVENMFLAAHSLGLGSCWIGFAKILNKDKDSLRRLGIPNDFEIVAPLIFGYPAQIKDRIPNRKPKILKWIK